MKITDTLHFDLDAVLTGQRQDNPAEELDDSHAETQEYPVPAQTEERMGQPLNADQEVMLAYAEQTEQMALMLDGTIAFDPSVFQGMMMTALGPVGAPFAAAFTAAITNQHINAHEVAAALHAHAQATRESALHYQTTEELNAAELAADKDLAEELGDQLDSVKSEAALPAFLKDQLDPLEPGQTQFVGDIASTRHELEKAGIKGADLGIPAKLADGTPIMLFGDSNKPGETAGYNGGIVAAKVENTPEGVKVTAIEGWGPGQLLADHQLAPEHQYYPSGVITLSDGRQFLNVANVYVGDNPDGSPLFEPQYSHLVQIGGADGNWPTVSADTPSGNFLTYATGMQLDDHVWVAATENTNGPISLYNIPVDEITDMGSWSQYQVGDPITNDGGATPNMIRVGDQYALSYMGDGGLHVMLADNPGDFAGVQAQLVDLEHNDYPKPPGFGQAYGGYILPDSQPDDLRFAVSYWDTEGKGSEPYGVGEWRYRPQ
ncbi:hypothetical protein Srot_1893 [Segniliparus rotundus DSM 44985]|uniref:DUF4185 domain-containing protein n=1 Tax=Segniliparus rotundus (strain ATCC BAA-972 / CDC 1076 / CIP 108378 / DSM 44985 / JCM 13578) TaxID=640132 RepID=D6Z8S3_SEGRD|nr:DUF4185 domain-containing protein [Segniliparus rotundus]ADG98353.1 hypothetical protein Srot_1893 [Segniliparus rotundus DSM 44985]